MIFVGDIAHPFPQPPIWDQNRWPWATGQSMIANLEGSLKRDVGNNFKSRKLFNHVSIINALVSSKIKAVSLANNHIMDMPGALVDTCASLRARKIQFTGAGENLRDAAAPAKITHAGNTYLFLGLGWETIQCKPADEHKSGVNPLRPIALLHTVKYWRTTLPSAVLVLLLHWNYEMELYPQPADRQLAMAAIDAGADAIIGHHPHRVGGIELYKDKPIAYSLGNWWMPQGVYCRGRLRFGDESLLQLALEWNHGDEPLCHWFRYVRETHELTYVDSERLTGSPRIKELTPFSGMSHDNYKHWFKKHRIKRKILPIYYDYRHRYRNIIKDNFVHIRHLVITALVRSGLKN